MKALILVVLTAAPLFAQEVAPPPVQLPQPKLDFRDFKLPGRPNPFSWVKPVNLNAVAHGPKINLVAAGPKTCAIPLIQVTPKGNYPMNVVKPGDHDPKMSLKDVPSPACVTPGRP